MSNTLTTSAPTNGHGPGPIGSVQRVEPRLVQQIQTQNRVVQVRADIPRGAVIKASDLAEITVGSVQGVSTVPAEQLPGLVGQRATIDLAEGSLLPDGGIGAVAIPAAGQTLVGLRLEQGRMVIGDVRTGSRLRLIVTAPQGGDPAFKDGNSGRQFAAVLVEISPALDGAATLVNVQVAQKDANPIAQLAATGRIAIVQEPQR